MSLWLPSPGLVAAAGATSALGIELISHNGNGQNISNRDIGNVTLAIGERGAGQRQREQDAQQAG